MEGTKQELEESPSGKRILTDIAPFQKFYLAEAYHQKYHLRRKKALMDKFNAIYPYTRGFIDSTAARVNGYLAGYGVLENLREELDRYGLSKEGKKLLLNLVTSR